MRRELRQISRAGDTPWWVRDRIEMILLSAEGWSASCIAGYLSCHPQTVRRVLKSFQAQGLEVLERRLPGPEPDETYRARVEGAIDELLSQERIWTAKQLSAALRQYKIVLGERQVRRYLHGMGAQWRRTKNTLEHKQRPSEVRTAKKQLARLKKSPYEAFGPVFSR